jgi:hypothetical protein
MSLQKPTAGEENWQGISPGKSGAAVQADGKGRMTGRKPVRAPDSQTTSASPASQKKKTP